MHRSVLSVTMAISILLGACTPTAGDSPTIGEARAELLGYVGDVTKSDGYRYDAIDDRGHGMSGAKIIQIDETDEFAAEPSRI